MVSICAAAISNSAQSTTFNYQGKLTDTGTPQSIYQMQFGLFDSLVGGTQIGTTIDNPSVAVSQGVFSVKLDFGASVFTGADRFLQISVRRSAAENYTILTPREKIASSPYSVRTLSAAQADLSLDSNKLGGIAASEYVTNTNVGSSFIKNAATLQTANFNITGNGFVGGNFGIGTTAPTSKLQVEASGYGITQTSGGITVGSFITTFNGGSGWLGTRSNHPLNFFTNDSLPQMTLTTAGNFGIGITTPTAKLQVFNSAAGVTGLFSESPGSRAVWGKSTTNSGIYGETAVSSLTAAGVYGVGTGSGSIGVIGESNINNAVGVFGVTTSPSGVAVYARNNFGGRAIYAEGNISQNLVDNGVVKAMIFVNQNGTINRCYNSQTNSSTGNCGFTIATPGAGIYDINFGFQVDNRYIMTSSISNFGSGGCYGGDATIDPPVGNLIRVRTSCTAEFLNKPFMIFVY